MKKFSILMLSFLAITAMISCDDDNEELFTTEPTSDFTFRSTPSASYVLTFDTKDNLAERLLWNDLEFSTPVAVTYEVQASADASNFDNPVVVTSTNETSAALSVERLNEVAASVGLTPFTPGVVAMRVKASLADASMEPQYTDVLSLNVTSYTTESPRLWVPGNYAASSGYGADWSPGDANTPFLEAVEFGSTEFEGFIFMDVASPEFKFTPEQDWDEDFGDNGADGTLDAGGANLTVPGPGYYYITVNTDPDGDPATNDGTWSARATSWAIIGAATPNGWSDPDTDMTYNAASKKWEVTVMMTQDNFKFRANDDWGTPTNNFGADADVTNGLQFNASDISFDQAPGNYLFELDLSQPRAYTYTATSI
ncbi:SusE domain-containing protein [Nonlabens xiamenensis]|uniref:SusE domain-containing protein n=1 Tax=Nonlabens xiamenensis TaxID=2341043 RepID=UPI000F60959A|nr:SusE domain-containing protein [Nonlabens xiamenensis]